jgi:hypothetical protein
MGEKVRLRELIQDPLKHALAATHGDQPIMNDRDAKRL